MLYRLRIFTFTFANYFENLLQQEIAKIDLNKHIRQPGGARRTRFGGANDHRRL